MGAGGAPPTSASAPWKGESRPGGAKNSTKDTAGGVTQVGAKPQFQKAKGKRRSRKARSLLKPGQTAFPSEGGELKLNSERKEQRSAAAPVPPVDGRF